MARPPRIDWAGAWHHVMHRGARRQNIFQHDADVLRFMELLGETVAEHGLEVHAYALMPNHYHMLVRSVHGTLSAGMQQLHGRFTQAMNRAHGWDGALFRGRFRSQRVDDESYLMALTAYIHLNPIRAALVRRLDAHCWTSHRAYMGREQAPAWLTTRDILARFGNRAAFHSWVDDLRRGREPWPSGLNLESGRISTATCDEVEPEPHRPHERTSVELCMRRITTVTQTDRAELLRAARGPHANPARRFAVWALRQHAGLTHREIGEVLAISPNQVSKILSRLRRSTPPPLREWMQSF